MDSLSSLLFVLFRFLCGVMSWGVLEGLLSWREIWEFVRGSERVFLFFCGHGKTTTTHPVYRLFKYNHSLHYLFCPFTAIIQENIQLIHLILVFFLFFYSSDYFLVTFTVLLHLFQLFFHEFNSLFHHFESIFFFFIYITRQLNHFLFFCEY